MRALAATVVLSVGLAGGAGCREAQTDPRAAGRCLALELDPGPRLDSAVWDAAPHPPDTVALDSEGIGGRFGDRGFRLRPTLDGRMPRTSTTTPVWHRKNDTLVLAWNDGRAGVRITGRLAGSRFEGWATLVDDVGIGRRQARARAAGRIVECPTSLTSASSSAESSRWTPPGCHFVPGPALPDSLRETREEGRFTISIARVAHDDFERELLWRAEGLVPDSERIREAIDTAKGWSARGARAVDTLPGERWWWSEVDGVLLPYAANATAAAYYTTRVRTLSVEPNPFDDVWFGFPHRASFSYEAEVVRVSEGEGPSREEEVRIRLRWRFVCGSRCGVFFTHTRTVRFDGDGRVLDVTGDGPTVYALS